MRELANIRRQGYTIDEGEQEIGVRCIAVPVPGLPTLTALSCSGPASRLTTHAITDHLPLLKHTAAQLTNSMTIQATG